MHSMYREGQYKLNKRKIDETLNKKKNNKLKMRKQIRTTWRLLIVNNVQM